VLAGPVAHRVVFMIPIRGIANRGRSSYWDVDDQSHAAAGSQAGPEAEAVIQPNRMLDHVVRIVGYLYPFAPR
jgi:hypothetical protein